MTVWDEFVAFLKGTRPRPPPGPRSPLATTLLVAASLLHLPLVYLLIAHTELTPPFALTVGLLAMGLAWSGGCSLEGRRRGTVRALAAAGVLEGALVVVPQIADALGPSKWLFVAIGACSALALLALLRAR